MSKKILPIIKQIKNTPIKKIDFSKEKLISYSQYSMWVSCPHKWATTYKDNNKVFSDSIHTIFGTALHETLQHYLETSYTISGVEADKIDIEKYFQDTLISLYNKSVEKNNKSHFSTASEMREFYNDGIAILTFIKKNRRTYFPSRKWHLVGIELPIVINPHPDYPKVVYKGLLDLVMYNENTDSFYIFDIKTSTKGWNDWAKKDELKQFQLVMYKYFFSKQFDIDIDRINIEFFIVRRKIDENLEYPPKRVQSFTPASGKNKTNKAIKSIQNFIEECFDKEGNYIEKIYNKQPGNLCKFCPFNNTELCVLG